MKFSVICVISSSVIFFGCASHEKACEDVTLASEQIQECQLLQRQIVNAKEQPLIRTELERRYQTDCVEIRYYRDDHQPAICGNKENLEEIKRAVIEEQDR